MRCPCRVRWLPGRDGWRAGPGATGRRLCPRTARWRWCRLALRLPLSPQPLSIPPALLALRPEPRRRSLLPACSACPLHPETTGLQALTRGARVAALNSTGQVRSARCGPGARQHWPRPARRRPLGHRWRPTPGEMDRASHQGRVRLRARSPKRTASRCRARVVAPGRTPAPGDQRARAQPLRAAAMAPPRQQAMARAAPVARPPAAVLPAATRGPRPVRPAPTAPQAEPPGSEPAAEQPASHAGTWPGGGAVAESRTSAGVQREDPYSTTRTSTGEPVPTAMRSSRSAHACRCSSPAHMVMAPSAPMSTQGAQRIPSPITAASTSTQADQYGQAHPGSGDDS